MYRIIITSIFICLFSIISVTAQEWEIPQDKKNMKPAIYFDETSVRAGKEIYQKHCASCHGDLGLKNFQKLTPSPGDLSNTETTGNTNGELFFKIFNGKGLMPSFAKVISDGEKWQVISYLRNSHEGFEHSVDFNAEIVKYSGKVNLDIEALKESKRLKIYVTGEREGIEEPLKVAVTVRTKCTFGDLPLGDVVTDKYGFAFVDYPAGLPGDKDGNIELTIQLKDTSVYGQVFVKERYKAAIPFVAKDILAGKHLWSVGTNPPTWLLLSYLIVVILIWAFIFYIILLLRKIKKV